MSKRLQVIMGDKEYQAIRKSARQQKMSLSEWVRQALYSVQRRQPVQDAQAKLDAIRRAARHEYPTGDISQILREIESGYLDSGRSSGC